MKLHELVYGVSDLAILNKQDIEITGITCDSRKVKPGYIFTALLGSKTDGVKYIQQAIANGAKAILSNMVNEKVDGVVELVSFEPRIAYAKLCAKFVGEPAKDLDIIGITGTNGKTTISYLLQEILNKSGIPAGRLGTIDNDLGSGNVTNSEMTTTFAEVLHAYLKSMKENSLKTAVIEVSSHSLHQKRTFGLEYKVGIFTNLTQDHLDYHKTLFEYASAKGGLFQQVAANGVSLINSDAQFAGLMIKNSYAPVKTYSINVPSNYQAKNLHLSASGTTFDLKYPGGYAHITSPMLGIFNVYNILATFGAAHSMQAAPLSIIRALSSAIGAPGRLEKVTKFDSDVNIIVDYAHTPDALENVLKTMKNVSAGKLTVVFGAGGDRDISKRPLMGKTAFDFADKVIITSDNPRTEDPTSIIEDIETGLPNKSKHQTIVNREHAIATAISQAESNETIIIAGKGHEDYQIIGTDKMHFDDREWAKYYYEKYFNSDITKIPRCKIADTPKTNKQAG